MTLRRNTLLRLTAIATLASLTGLTHVAAVAQAYPSKPIRVIVPFPAGSTTDIIARAIAGGNALPS